MSGQAICCQIPGCRASIFWVGHPADPALVKFAEGRGYRLFEGRGWRCTVHARDEFPSLQPIEGEG